MPKKIPTVEQWREGLEARMHEVGECVEWSGALAGPTPVVSVPRGIYSDVKANSKQTVRAVVWFLHKGRRMKPDHVILARCCNHRCVKFSHLIEVSRAEANNRYAEAGAFSTISAKTRRMIGVISRVGTKLTVEIAKEIRMSDEPTAVLAKRYGVHRESINAVRRGERWKEAANGASVFTWRPAA